MFTVSEVTKHTLTCVPVQDRDNNLNKKIKEILTCVRVQDRENNLNKKIVKDRDNNLKISTKQIFYIVVGHFEYKNPNGRYTIAT